MFKVTESGSVRWFMVAIEDQSEAEVSLRAEIGDGGVVESKAIPAQVIEFVQLPEGKVQRWMPA